MSFGKGLFLFLFGVSFIIFGSFGGATLCMSIGGIGELTKGAIWGGLTQAIDKTGAPGFIRALMQISLWTLGTVLWLITLIIGSIVGAIICPLFGGILGLIFGGIMALIGFISMFFGNK